MEELLMYSPNSGAHFSEILCTVSLDQKQQKSCETSLQGLFDHTKYYGILITVIRCNKLKRGELAGVETRCVVHSQRLWHGQESHGRTGEYFQKLQKNVYVKIKQHWSILEQTTSQASDIACIVMIQIDYCQVLSSVREYLDALDKIENKEKVDLCWYIQVNGDCGRSGLTKIVC